ncbi:MAG: hypothetical protein HGA44_12055 [Cellulomonadaceae bacterium]|nr:hypothetical protein [Cellulomonadaceae bacterium]
MGAWLTLVVANAAMPDSTLAWRVLGSLAGSAASVAFAIAGFGALSEAWAAAEWRRWTGELATASLEHCVRTVRRLIVVTVSPAGPLLESHGGRLGDLASTFGLPPDPASLRMRGQMCRRLLELRTELGAIERRAKTAQGVQWTRHQAADAADGSADVHEDRGAPPPTDRDLDPALVSDLVTRAHECSDDVRSTTHSVVEATTELCGYVGGQISIDLTRCAQALRVRGEEWLSTHGASESAISSDVRDSVPRPYLEAAMWHGATNTASWTVEEMLTLISVASTLERALEKCRAELARRPGLRVEHVKPW